MIKMSKGSLQTRFFMWCLQNPMTRGSKKGPDGKDEYRPREYYIENGTTLCHFFWACFWCPLILMTPIVFVAFVLISIHVNAYEAYGAPGLLIPSGVFVGCAAAVACAILAVIGGGKIGLLAYLAALKKKICPLMKFED